MKIKQLYIPTQPTVKQTSTHVSYRELAPSLQLQDNIYCYWQLKTHQSLTEQFNYKVVADGCIDIFFELNNPDENFVMGFCKKYTEFPLGNSFNYIGVRFFPTMFPQLFKVDASELSNRFEELKFVIPPTAKFISNSFKPELTIHDVKNIFDAYFLNLKTNIIFDEDTRVYEAIEIILKNYGMVQLEKDLNTGISQRQLRRLFKYYIGDTPKTFCKVVRFQNILRAKPSTQSLKQNKLFFNQGYYDQAHFIKEFKNFYGVTPSKAFGRE